MLNLSSFFQTGLNVFVVQIDNSWVSIFPVNDNGKH
jgi:hypothetical protein